MLWCWCYRHQDQSQGPSRELDKEGRRSGSGMQTSGWMVAIRAGRVERTGNDDRVGLRRAVRVQERQKRAGARAGTPGGQNSRKTWWTAGRDQRGASGPTALVFNSHGCSCWRGGGGGAARGGSSINPSNPETVGCWWWMLRVSTVEYGLSCHDKKEYDIQLFITFY